MGAGRGLCGIRKRLGAPTSGRGRWDVSPSWWWRIYVEKLWWVDTTLLFCWTVVLTPRALLSCGPRLSKSYVLEKLQSSCLLCTPPESADQSHPQPYISSSFDKLSLSSHMSQGPKALYFPMLFPSIMLPGMYSALVPHVDSHVCFPRPACPFSFGNSTLIILRGGHAFHPARCTAPHPCGSGR